MTRIVCEPSDPAQQPLERVVQQVIARGAPPARAVVVEDRDGTGWLRELVRLQSSARSRIVVAARSDEGLAHAVAMGLGGALWLPPGSESVTLALNAAHLTAGQCADTGESGCPSTVSLLLRLCGVHCVVAVARTVFWRRQLGVQTLAQRLLQLPTLLEVPVVVLPGPALLVCGVPAQALQEAWSEVPGEPQLDLQVRTLELTGYANDGVAQLLKIVGEMIQPVGESDAETPEGRWFSVYSVPSGKRVGAWSDQPGSTPAMGDWFAVPRVEADLTSRLVWDLPGKGSQIPEVTSRHEIDEAVAERSTTVRIPGWVLADFSRGRPAWLLVRALAEHAAMRGVRLWLGNVDGEALTEVLKLPGELWIDGSAVPSTR